MITGDSTDEFEVKATCPTKGQRVWTRDSLEAAKSIADQAISKLGYTRAQVVNTFGGHRSNVLYLAEPWPRTYYMGVDITQERLTLVVNRPLMGIPYSVWSDILKHSYCSISNPTTEVFYFSDAKHAERAERVLQGALFTREEVKAPTRKGTELPEDYEVCGYCGFDHSYEYESAHKWHINNPGQGY